MSDCVFCNIVSGKSEATFVYQDDKVSAFMDLLPINRGHLLVIPNAHAVTLRDLDPATGAHMMQVAQRAAAAIRNSDIKCDGVNLLLADGEAAGQEIFHAHLHVIPRFGGDDFGFKRTAKTERLASREELEEVGTALKSKLE
jgi:histidine triad (HIT) family protein